MIQLFERTARGLLLVLMAGVLIANTLQLLSTMSFRQSLVQFIENERVLADHMNKTQRELNVAINARLAQTEDRLLNIAARVRASRENILALQRQRLTDINKGTD